MLMSRRLALAAGSLIAAGWARKPARAADGIGALRVDTPPKDLPALSWVDEAGVSHRLADYKGRGVVLNFWATWCGPCVAEMPSLSILAAQLRTDGIVVLPVSDDSGGAPAVQAFFAAHHIGGLGVFLDPKSAATDAIGAEGLPTTLIVDRAGREVARMAGAADWGAPGMAQRVRALCGVQAGKS